MGISCFYFKLRVDINVKMLYYRYIVVKKRGGDSYG